MDTGDIERRSVNYLNNLLSRCPKLIPYISQNDKTPSWDGEIHLHSSLEKKKENLLGPCRIQVKGTYQKVSPTILDELLSYQVEVSDLSNYIRNGGVIYFVVVISGSPANPYDYQSYTCTAYYASLLPYDIKQLLKEVKPGQKTKKVSLHRLPNDPNKIENIIEDFFFNMRKQYSTYQEDATIEFSDGGASYNIFFNGNKPLISGQPTYIYKSYADKISVAVGKIIIEEVKIDNLDLVVRIDGKTYFYNVHLDITDNDKLYHMTFNHGLQIKIEDGITFHIDLTKDSTIDEYIKNLEFMLALKNGNTIDIGSFIHGENPKIDDKDDALNYELTFFKKIQALLKYLHIKKKVKVESLSEETINKLLLLHNTILLGHHLRDEKRLKQDLIGTIVIGPYHFFLMRIRKKGREFVFKDPFHDNMNCQMSVAGSSKFNASLALWLAVNGNEDADNIDYQAVKDSITKLTYCNDLSGAVIKFILVFLKKYDDEKNPDILSCVESIAAWLYSCDKSVINHLNLLQCIYRERVLTEEEQDALISYKHSQTDNKILAGINILLDNKSEYRYYLKKMSGDDLAEFQGYPIYHLTQQNMIRA